MVFVTKNCTRMDVMSLNQQFLLTVYKLISHVTAFVLSMIGSFFMNTYFTYKTKLTLKKFFQFPLTYVVNVIITTSSIYILVELLKLNKNIAPLISSLIAIPFTYVISKKILVTKKDVSYTE
ncbi:GtrA family protein [Bacillus wiedmannii]|uniref:GtrA family protein n=2 Tax=Bacillus wiedmannii TaxID=1890302 RepID=UPI0009B57E9F